MAGAALGEDAAAVPRVQRHRPAEAASAEASGLAPAADGAASLSAKQASFAEFIFVKPTHEATLRAFVTHAGNMAYAAAHEMVGVVFPRVNEAVGGSVITFSDIRASTGVLNLLGGVVVGGVSDRTGPKLTLMLSHASAAATFFLVGAASSVRWLYWSILPALTMHAHQAGTHVMTLNSETGQRARALGRVGAGYSIGFFAGSILLLGVLPIVGPQKVALLAAGVELAIVGLVFALYPEEEAGDLAAGAGDGSIVATMERMVQVLRRPGVAPVLTFKLAVAMAAGSVLFMTQQFAVQPFGFTASESALLMAYIGGFQLISQALVVDDASPRALYAASAIAISGSLLGLAATPPSKHAFVFWLAPLTLCFNMSRTMLQSLLTLSVPQDEMGSVIGYGIAMLSIGHIVAVPAAARLFHAKGFAAVPLAAATFLLGSTAAVLLVGFTPPDFDGAPAGAPEDTGAGSATS